METALAWSLERPPILDADFLDDRAAGELARDAWYAARKRAQDEPLPVVDPQASADMQKKQRHARSLLWKKALRRWNNAQRDHDAEAERKRVERSSTWFLADHGDAPANARMDMEVERGKRRRLDAKGLAVALRCVVETAQRLRKQVREQGELKQQALSCVLEQHSQPAYRENAASHYHVLDSLARAFYGAQKAPDGSTSWDDMVACASCTARAESESMRSALLAWDSLFDPDYADPWPYDPWGYHVGGERLHRWARAPVPLPSELLLWAQCELDALQPMVATKQLAADSHDEDELDVIAAVVQGDEATWMADLEQSLDAEPQPRAELQRYWVNMSRADKATAQLLGFSFRTWHTKRAVVLCPWAELCDDERSAANRLGFNAQLWDQYAPKHAVVAPPAAAQTKAAHQWIATQLERTRSAELMFKQVCSHPFNATKEQPERLEPIASEPGSPYAAALNGMLYDVHAPCELPAFVRPRYSRRSARNPHGYCREHRGTWWTPIGNASHHGIYKNASCDCVIGDPGLEPCAVCGGGLSEHEGCYKDVCKEVVGCYESLCVQLQQRLSKKERATEKARQNALTTSSGEWFRCGELGHWSRKCPYTVSEARKLRLSDLELFNAARGDVF